MVNENSREITSSRPEENSYLYASKWSYLSEMAKWSRKIKSFHSHAFGKKCRRLSFKCKLPLSVSPEREGEREEDKDKWGSVPRDHPCFISSAPQRCMIITSQIPNIRAEGGLFYPDCSFRGEPHLWLACHSPTHRHRKAYSQIPPWKPWNLINIWEKLELGSRPISVTLTSKKSVQSRYSLTSVHRGTPRLLRWNLSLFFCFLRQNTEMNCVLWNTMWEISDQRRRVSEHFCR